MRVFVLLCLLGAAAADKPSPTYKASPDAANSAPNVGPNPAAKTVYAQTKAEEKSDTVQPNYGAKTPQQQPQAAAKSDTGYAAQQPNVVQPPATQGYYYYYYPVTSGQNSHQQPYSGGQPQAYSRDGSGGHHGGGHGGHAAPHGHAAPVHAPVHGGGYSGGVIAGPGNGNSNLITPLIVIGGIFLALLFFGGLAAGGGNGLFGKRSFGSVTDSIGESLSNLDLGISVIDAVEMARNVLDAVNGVETQYERKK